ncbi:transcription antitermination factor NusB [Candidatus Cytomitobacter primus]|uniref:NusB/RsmB/TIM44 domain-containing protein n=1 Tax=Candidatus Cytomitobacter primus TaxID=2066024 RepID=A0A5C0UGP0_9PROT|nr:transcription antitermination factor NusB [Candidatus Cytomitobacter primus]QEK38462.1 hypothetical protein FZC34_00830 [Candidatus Cytomitobacter primus]
MLKRDQTRFWKVQAVYQFLMLDDRLLVKKNFINMVDDSGDQEKFFTDFDKIVDSAYKLKWKFEQSLYGKWKWQNLNCLVQAIFLSAAYELSIDSRKKQIISEYIGLAKIFGEDESANFIHANLDQLDLNNLDADYKKIADKEKEEEERYRAEEAYYRMQEKEAEERYKEEEARYKLREKEAEERYRAEEAYYRMQEKEAEERYKEEEARYKLENPSDENADNPNKNNENDDEEKIYDIDDNDGNSDHLDRDDRNYDNYHSDRDDRDRNYHNENGRYYRSNRNDDSFYRSNRNHDNYRDGNRDLNQNNESRYNNDNSYSSDKDNNYDDSNSSE